MPYSVDVFRPLIREWLTERFSPNVQVIDIGAGAGVYAELLREHFTSMTAIEAFDPYVARFKLRAKYQMIIVDDMRNVDARLFRRAIVIMGDVLEHLGPADARMMLDRIIGQEPRALIVVVPFMMEQGVYMDNVLETHLQPDLTQAVIAERYPELRQLGATDEIGAYYWLPTGDAA